MNLFERGVKMIFISYKDDGPRGVCGQSMSVTAPRRILYRCSDLTQARKLLRVIEEDNIRRNPRVDGVWSDDELDGFDPIKEASC